jgi:hypothetical protein
MQLRAKKTYDNQGIAAELVILASAPESRSEEESWSAAGKSIGRVRSFFDGARGGQETTFGQDATYAGDELEQVRRKSTFHPILDLRELYSQVAVDRSEMLGGEDTYVVKLTPKTGSPVSLFVSARNSLILQEQTGGETMVFGEHRNIDGEVVPFRWTIQDALGTSTVLVQEVRFNPALPANSFGPRKP